MKSCISCRCIWLCFKALSGGVLLIAIGVGMTVFGFYADHFAVQQQLDEATNTTTTVVNEHLKLHLHNLTYVGPVFMGLGGMMIVAACVLMDAALEEAPKGTGPDVEEQHLITEATKAERCNGPTFFSLDLPPARVQDKGGGGEGVVTVAEVVRPPNGPRPPSLPVTSSAVETPLSTSSLSTYSPPPLRVAVRHKRGAGRRPRTMRTSSSFLFDAPSPMDIQILDPDGCTPGGPPDDSFEMDVFAASTKCHPSYAQQQQRLQLEPRYLASVESDGLSDSDAESSLFGGVLPSRRSRGGYCSPSEGQDMPLLGRCSPPSSPEYPVEPLLKRDRTGLRRFQLMRQVPNSRTLFDGPSSEGGSR